MSDRDVYDQGKVHVRSADCDHCLLSKDRLVNGRRAAELIAASRDGDAGSFICHRSQVSDEHAAICRRWWNAFAMENVTLRLAVCLDIVCEVGVRSAGSPVPPSSPPPAPRGPARPRP